jgi:hypothetical protein
MRLGALVQMQQAAFETHIFRHSSAKVVAGLILTKRQGDPLPRILLSQPKEFAGFIQEWVVHFSGKRSWSPPAFQLHLLLQTIHATLPAHPSHLLLPTTLTIPVPLSSDSTR